MLLYIGAKGNWAVLACAFCDPLGYTCDLSRVDRRPSFTQVLF